MLPTLLNAFPTLLPPDFLPNVFFNAFPTLVPPGFLPNILLDALPDPIPLTPLKPFIKFTSGNLKFVFKLDLKVKPLLFAPGVS